MCLGLPMRIKKIEKDTALAEAEGITRKINVQFLGNVKINDYVIVHAGFAIEKVNDKRAKEMLELFKKIKPGASL